jgi:flagellar protein FliJ
MSPSPHAALHLLLQQAERARDEAVMRQQQAERQLRAAQSQGEQLSAYRGDCEQRWTQRFRQGSGIDIVQCYQGFIQRLHGAVAMQDDVMQRAAVQLERARAQTVKEELRVASIRALVERREAAARLAHERREQKMQDDMAARALALQRSRLDAAAMPDMPNETAAWTS